ncbi:MAG: thiamine phosphate synthase [Candidatus Omnitrophica bacterium]|nr:thiamine phosphate synthase [Candidatus Omnitrophota bacterium]
MRGYYFITDSGLSRKGNISDVKSAIRAKIGVVQYREKNKSTGEMHEEASKLRRICEDAIFLINDRVDIALGVNADGVHLGRSDLPYAVARRLLGKRKIIGLTVHTLKQAIQAQGLGADYIGVSPIFATHTKLDAGVPVGVELISKIKKRIRIPVIAIGGINLSNAKDVIRAGADGLCAISAVLASRDVRGRIERFQRLFRERGKNLGKNT